MTLNFEIELELSDLDLTVIANFDAEIDIDRDDTGDFVSTYKLVKLHKVYYQDTIMQATGKFKECIVGEMGNKPDYLTEVIQEQFEEYEEDERYGEYQSHLQRMQR